MVTTPTQKRLSFEEFLAQYPEDGRYERVHGALMRILATRRHDNVVDFVEEAFRVEIKRLQLNYRVSNRIV